jgi:hypothetical protein
MSYSASFLLENNEVIFRLYVRGDESYEYLYSKKVGQEYFENLDFPLFLHKENTVGILGRYGELPWAVLVINTIDDDTAEKIFFEDLFIFAVLRRV